VAARDVAGALERHAEVLRSAARVVVAYSGGLDSTVLLEAAHALLGTRVEALHANHGLHGDAGRWEKHCVTFCARHQIPLTCHRLSVQAGHHGLEAAARDARYAWFGRCLDAGDLLLLAHHQDDQAETLLLRLLRGAGPEGLGAMAEHRTLGGGALLRPFLDLPRSTLASYARLRCLEWIEDPSNEDEHFDRNYLRRCVMPALSERWPAYRRTFARAAELLREEGALRAQLAPKLIRSVTGDPGFALADLPAEPAQAAVAVRAWLRARGLAMPGRARLAEFLRQLEEGRGACLAMPCWCLTRFGDQVFAHPPPQASQSLGGPLAPGESRLIPGVGEIRLARVDGVRGPSDDAWPAGIPLALATRRGGERIATPSGQHRRLKTVLQEARVPPWWRSRVPLLIPGDGGGDSVLACGPFASAPALQSRGLVLYWEPAALVVSD